MTLIVKVMKPGAARHAASTWRKRGGCTQGTSVPTMTQQYDASNHDKFRSRNAADFKPRQRRNAVPVLSLSRF